MCQGIDFGMDFLELEIEQELKKKFRKCSICGCVLAIHEGHEENGKWFCDQCFLKTED